MNSNSKSKANEWGGKILKADKKLQQTLNPGLWQILQQYRITGLFKNEDFDGILTDGGLIGQQEESLINEIIIEKLSSKIIQEKQHRLEAKLQMERLRSENLKWKQIGHEKR